MAAGAGASTGNARTPSRRPKTARRRAPWFRQDHPRAGTLPATREAGCRVFSDENNSVAMDWAVGRVPGPSHGLPTRLGQLRPRQPRLFHVGDVPGAPYEIPKPAGDRSGRERRGRVSCTDTGSHARRRHTAPHTRCQNDHPGRSAPPAIAMVEGAVVPRRGARRGSHNCFAHSNTPLRRPRKRVAAVRGVVRPD